MTVIVHVLLKTQHLEQASSPGGATGNAQTQALRCRSVAMASMRRAPRAWSYPSGGHGFRPFLNTAKTSCGGGRGQRNCYRCPHDG